MDSGANFLRWGVFYNVATAVPHFSNNNNLFIAKGHNVKTIKTLLFLLTVIGLTACKQVNITAPTSNFVDDDKPSAFTLTFTGGAPTDLKIQLNSTIVTDRFAVTATGATATGDQLADVVYPGRNFFRVTGNKMVKQITFYYDTEGPSIRILDTDHEGKTVTGYVEDKGGFDFLTSALEGELSDRDFKPMLAEIGPIGLNLILLDVSVTTVDLHFKKIDVDLVVKDDERIDTVVAMDDFSLQLLLSQKILGFEVFKTMMTLKIADPENAQDDLTDNVILTTDLALAIKNSDLSIALKNTSLQNSYIKLDFDIVPNFLESITDLFLNGIFTVLKPVFFVFVDDFVMPIASEFIRDIPIKLQLVTLDDGEKINIRALPKLLDSKNNGVSVDLGTKIWAPEPNPAVPGALGSLYVEGSTPTLGHLTPDGEPFDFGASISSNVINQAFLAAHEAGVTTMEIRPEIYPNATQEGIQVYAQGADFGEGAKIGMRIEPASAPYILFMPSTDGAPGKFGWSDVNLYFDLYKPEWGEYRTLFGVTFDLEVPFDINTTDDGYLSIGIEQLPTIHISKTASDGMLLIPPAFINGTLDYFMPKVMPRLAEKLKVVPLPRIYNHTLHMQQFWIAGTGNNNLSLAGNLVPLAATAAATPPTSVVDYSAKDITVQQESVR